MPSTDLFLRYKPAIMELPVGRPYTKEQLLTDKFLLHREGKLEMYYAPHNEYINTRAKVVIIGITPGWAEMELAFRIARIGLEQGLEINEISKRVKTASQFTGATRTNLSMMLNSLGLHKKLGISSCNSLFTEHEELLYATAMLGYPVFAAGKNYNGHSPSLHSVPFLKHWAVRSLTEELIQLEHALVIPLGKAVDSVLRILISDGLVRDLQCLWGFPHPSGVNVHRHTQFSKVFEQMQETICRITF